MAARAKQRVIALGFAATFGTLDYALHDQAAVTVPLTLVAFAGILFYRELVNAVLGDFCARTHLAPGLVCTTADVRQLVRCEMTEVEVQCCSLAHWPLHVLHA